MSELPGRITDMSENESKQTNETAAELTDREIEAYENRRDAQQPDMLLGVLVSVADEDGAELGVTLTVGGTLICGMLTGRRAWLAKMIEQYGKPVEFMRTFDRLWAEQDTAGDPHPDLPAYAAYIHLTDAYALTGAGRAPSGGGMFWRGRLSEIEGWSLGLISTSE